MPRRDPAGAHPSRPADPLRWVGAVLEGHFAVEAVAGDGGFGIVYRGRHLGLEVPVAIKCLKLPARLGPAERKRFLARLQREARLMHRLSRRTPGIVQALHVGAATSPSGAWTPYLVMEWAAGETLERHLSSRRRAGAAPPGLAGATRLLAPAARAIAAMHESGVAHLDLKPANLVFARGGADAALKVLDFGVARTFSEDTELTATIGATADRRWAFTPQYGAPEQFSAEYGAPGPWTDVFAMALILAEVATGRRALAGTSVMQLFVAAIHEDTRTRLCERLPRAAEALIRRALEVSPELRYPTMGAFWAALEGALDGAHGAAALPADEAPEGAEPATITATQGSIRARVTTVEPVATTGQCASPEEMDPPPAWQSGTSSAPRPRAARRRLLLAALPLAAVLPLAAILTLAPHVPARRAAVLRPIVLGSLPAPPELPERRPAVESAPAPSLERAHPKPGPLPLPPRPPRPPRARPPPLTGVIIPETLDY